MPDAPQTKHSAHSPAATRSPTICTAMTFTIVIDGKDHRISDVGTLGRRHPGRIDENGGISRCARRDADQIVVGNLHQVVADQQHDSTVVSRTATPMNSIVKPDSATVRTNG